MRLNQFLAKHTNLSRRSADAAIGDGRVQVNGQAAQIGQEVSDTDEITLDSKPIETRPELTIMFNKPLGYVCSRVGQGNDKTIYDILPAEYQHLTYLGRLDKDSCGLLILSNDGELIQRVTHPSHETIKRYEVQLDKPLTDEDRRKIEDGVMLEDGLSQLDLQGTGKDWVAELHEGRNRQIRRTFLELGYLVRYLKRVSEGELALGDLAEGAVREIQPEDIL